jgi:ATP phosphoribosyltransferase
VDLAPITVAVPKGRVLKPLAALLARAGVPADVLLADDRALIRTVDDGAPVSTQRPHAGPFLRFLLLKPDDVPTYVEYGAADLGVCGRDVLAERASELYQPLDLGIGKCRMVVAGPVGQEAPRDLPRVATKYPRTAAAHFARRGVQAEIVYVQGSVELAPVTGLADLIVDLVETGATLVKNGLAERDIVAKVSSVLVANRASYKLRHDEIAPLVDRLREAVDPAE